MAAAADAPLWSLIRPLESELIPTQGVKRKMQIKVTANKAMRRLFLKNTRWIYHLEVHRLPPDGEICNKPHFVILKKETNTPRLSHYWQLLYSPIIYPCRLICSK